MSVPINTKRHPNAEPIDDPASHAWLDEGIEEFNAGRHWHAHEAWEHLWLGLEGDDKMFVQGCIMSAAMLHQYARKVQRGVLNHHENATVRMQPHGPQKWGIDVAGLLAQLAPFDEAAQGEDWSLDPGTVQIRRTR